MSRNCQWCENQIETMYGYDNICILSDKPSMAYFFDSWKCVVYWILSINNVNTLEELKK